MSRFSKVILIFTMFASLFFGTKQVLAQTANTASGTSKFIPDCALKEPTGNPSDEGECRSISIFVILLLKFVSYLFTIVGALALLAFIYGGFTLILSQGSSDQVKKGKDILVAAIIGLVIVFSAYMLVRFLGTAVGLKTDYTLLG
ncbi:MAG TPA: pilin [Candidatus Udaeobacter sp.]|nr:pilin [Candidatus Udaeobacter sp.]